MGIVILNAALSTTLAMIRTTDLPATLSIAYATVRPVQAGTSYVENGRELVAFLRNNGWPANRELRVQWAVSPPAPAQLVTEVRTTLAQSFGSLVGVGVHSGPSGNSALGAQAFTNGNGVGFGNASGNQTLGHEATHVVQQLRGSTYR